MQGRSREARLGMGVIASLCASALVASCADPSPSSPVDSVDLAFTTQGVWTWSSSVASGSAGASVAGPGDVNGDGFDELLVGAHLWTGAFSNEGAALLFLGSPTGFGSVPDWTITGGEGGAQAGTTVASAGDVNGDGFGDLLVGVPLLDAGGVDAGAAWLFLGSATGPAASPDWVSLGAHPGAEHGASVAGVGDVNGDGFGDVLVGAPLEQDTLSDEGAVHLYYGSATGLSTAPDWSAWSGQAAADLGRAVAWAGDIDGDGFSDLLAGARYYDAGSPGEGAAFFWFGGANGPGTVVDWSVADAGTGDQFGRGLSGVGDTDGDGYGEIIVGAPLYGGAGAAWLYPGSASGPQAATIAPITGNTDDLLGFRVAPAGDLDADGYADALLAVPWYGTGNGRVYLYLGDAGGLDLFSGGQDHMWSAAMSWNLGKGVATVGDADGDGASEIAVGLPGVSSSSNGGGGVAHHEAQPPSPAAAAGASLVGGQADADLAPGDASIASGDLNADGYDELIVGRPGWDGGLVDQGSVAVHFGGPTGVSSTEDLLVLGGTAGERFGTSVALADADGDGELDLFVELRNGTGDPAPRDRW